MISAATGNFESAWNKTIENEDIHTFFGSKGSFSPDSRTNMCSSCDPVPFESLRTGDVEDAFSPFSTDGEFLLSFRTCWPILLYWWKDHIIGVKYNYHQDMSGMRKEEDMKVRDAKKNRGRVSSCLVWRVIASSAIEKGGLGRLRKILIIA